MFEYEGSNSVVQYSEKYFKCLYFLVSVDGVTGAI